MQNFWSDLLSGVPGAALIAGVVMAGLWAVNLLYDWGMPQYVSRKMGHVVGGFAFLMGGILFASAWWPMIIAAFFALLLLGARLFKPHTFRGVGGDGRDSSIYAEVWFALVAVPVFGIAWYWLDFPGIAVSCLLFMAWGDGVTGLVRAKVYRRPVKGAWGSAAMLVICLAIAIFLVRPVWIGIAGAMAAVISERVFGDLGAVRWADDNWAIPAASLLTIVLLLYFTGGI